MRVIFTHNVSNNPRRLFIWFAPSPRQCSFYRQPERLFARSFFFLWRASSPHALFSSASEPHASPFSSSFSSPSPPLSSDAQHPCHLRPPSSMKGLWLATGLRH